MSGSQKSGSRGVNKQEPDTEAADEKKLGKQRTEIGRALRSVYDDTLREHVPDDFKDLLGKLS